MPPPHADAQQGPGRAICQRLADPGAVSLCAEPRYLPPRRRSDLKRTKREHDGRDDQGPARPACRRPGRPSWRRTGHRSATAGCAELADATLATPGRLGIGRNDRVAIVLPNGPEMATAFIAVACGCHHGAAQSGLPRGGVRLLPDRSAGQGAGRAGRRRGPGGRRGTAARRPRSCGCTCRPTAPAGWFELAPEADGAGDRRRSRSRPRPDDVALVLHTSGTTSRPKIVPLLQRNLAASAAPHPRPRWR